MSAATPSKQLRAEEETGFEETGTIVFNWTIKDLNLFQEVHADFR